jgi:hypothetical protein
MRTANEACNGTLPTIINEMPQLEGFIPENAAVGAPPANLPEISHALLQANPEDPLFVQLQEIIQHAARVEVAADEEGEAIADQLFDPIVDDDVPPANSVWASHMLQCGVDTAWVFP